MDLPSNRCQRSSSMNEGPNRQKPKLPPRRLSLLQRGSPKRFRLHTQRKVLDEYGKVRKWTYRKIDASKPNKIILLVGETGVGKTTIINTMVNYLLNVKFEDEIWYEITEEAARDQSESQTSEITVYEVFPVESPISLTIIDTPGYGDTRGLDKDLEVAENLATLFQSKDGVHEVDAVCFVTQASKNRLSDRQHYIISSVLSLFGKDIVDNIVFLITHSDGLPPKNAISAIKKAKIPCRRDKNGEPVYFLFNNRQAEERHTKERHVRAQRDAWEDSVDGMKYFLQSLNEMKRRSLELTSDVLVERIRFEAYISNLQLRVQEKELKKTEKLQIQEAMMQNKKNVEQSINFTFKVKKTDKMKVPIESKSWKHRKATTCTVCEENCHEFDCWWTSNPSKCEVMKNGFCTVCTGKCHHSKHVKENKKYVIRNSSMQLEFDSIKKEYETSQEQTKTFLILMQHLEKDLKVIEDHKSILLCEAYQTIKHLSQIALKPDSAFTLQHLDFFIPRVREAGKEKWARELEEMRRNAEAEEVNKDALSYLKAGLTKLFLTGK
uniref:AIG1-type G domain-containing protein n=1 Tax=Cyprinus carpio TaxID=7962 RepID=A0A8C2A2G9_CYPCA